jgi:hypothetical protein
MKKVLGFLLVMGFSVSLFAQSAPRTATLVQFEGDVKIKSAKDSAWQEPQADAVLSQGAIIKTGADSYAVLSVEDGVKTATIDLEENSQLLLAQLLADPAKKTQTTLLDLSLGKILVRAQKLRDPESKFEVKTPTSVVGIRGTVFSVQVEATQE